MTKSELSGSWYVYIVKCNDNSLYTGITTDIERRIAEHNDSTQNKGAKYTRSRQPVKLVFLEESGSRSEATKRELTIKKLNKKQKQLLISNHSVCNKN